jgi:hypothetical protein
VQNLSVRYRVTRFSIAAVLAFGARLGAQTPPSFASPLLPPNHWAVDAARRASALGLAPRAFAWGDGSLTQALVGWTLHQALAPVATAESSRRSSLHEQFRAEWERFAREFPAVAARLVDSSDSPVRPAGLRSIATSVTAGFVAARGQLLPVRSIDRTRENVLPPERVADLNDGDLEVRASGLGGRYLAGEVAAGRSDAEWLAQDWHVLGAVRSLGVWAGRRAPDFGPGEGGGLVFNGRAAFTGGGFELVNPIRLPSLFRVLGPVRAEAFLSRIDSSAAVRHPWVFGSHASIAPHPRLLLGATLAFMFIGEGLPPFTFRNFKEMFLTHGIKAAGAEFENGIASVEARWRPPTPGIPTVLYVEWASDDNHAAWFKFPAVVAGVSVPSVPGLPALSLGLERASFAAPCSSCDGCACEYYATWYRHYVFMDGWTLDRQPIGHPLGGDGTEWLAYGRLDDAPRGLRVNLRAFSRDRGRFNIYAPTRLGRSLGSQATLEYRLTPPLALEIDGSIERGRADWTASSLSAGVRWTP